LLRATSTLVRLVCVLDQRTRPPPGAAEPRTTRKERVRTPVTTHGTWCATCWVALRSRSAPHWPWR